MHDARRMPATPWCVKPDCREPRRAFPRKRKRPSAGRAVERARGVRGLGTATARTAATAAAAAAAERLAGFHGEPHVADVDADGFRHGQKFGVHAEGVAAFLEDFVGIVRLIQSQGQPGTASAAGGKVDPDGVLLLVRKVGIKLVSSTVGCAESNKYVPMGCLSMCRGRGHSGYLCDTGAGWGQGASVARMAVRGRSGTTSNPALRARMRTVPTCWARRWLMQKV